MSFLVGTAGTLETAAALDEIAGLLDDGDVLVLSGAGLSTESGIPDYRGPTGASRQHTPMTYQAFTGSPEARQRYWARSHLGWGQIAHALPNAGHDAVASLQRAGRLHGVITQNVDGLHQAAGAQDVVELHGGLDRVVCLTCGNTEGRASLRARMLAANPDFDARIARINPDGDAEIPDEALIGFVPPRCLVCSSDLVKPDVVFFGESVPKPRVQHCFELTAGCRALLVLGSSLTVMSGLRFVRRAAALGTPIAIVNQGPTRGDELATVKLEAPLGETLTALAGRG
ncbi:MAG: NAD-dependent protein deacetylase [Jatrophihabitans sp.]|uniref:NAD-dependent protein deacetylase n=1 Tax=Jatrophihabitans sp. TaxID=1932789 RepID=UPI003F80D05C